MSVTYNRSVVSSTNKTDHHDIAEILLKVVLNVINQEISRQFTKTGIQKCYPSAAPEFTLGFSRVRVAPSLVLYVCFVDHCLYFCTFSFGHCVVCSSSIYGFWLPLWYLQTLLKIKMLYVKVLVPKLIVARYFSRQKDLRAFQDHTGSRKAYVLHCRHFRNNNKRPESFPWYLSKIQFKYIQSNSSMLQLLFFCLQVARYFTRKLSESLPG